MKLLILSILLLITSSCVNVESFLYNYKGMSVVMLTAKRSGGTGFRVSIKDKSYIMTNAHICSIANTLYATSSIIKGHKAIKVIKIYKEHDLCIMEDIPEIPALKIASSSELREEVWLIGHPGLRPLTIERGYILGNEIIQLYGSCGSNRICVKTYLATQINNIAYGGNSGSPVVNMYGNVVGVLFAGSPSQATDSYVVPLSYIHSFIREL